MCRKKHIELKRFAILVVGVLLLSTLCACTNRDIKDAANEENTESQFIEYTYFDGYEPGSMYTCSIDTMSGAVQLSVTNFSSAIDVDNTSENYSFQLEKDALDIIIKYQAYIIKEGDEKEYSKDNAHVTEYISLALENFANNDLEAGYIYLNAIK